MAGAKLEIEPIVREGASERLLNHLLGMVKAGTLKPGERLPGERELAESFSVSRPTVREAVRALAFLGVVRTRHGGGIFVSPLEGADLLAPLTFFLTLRDVEVDRLYAARRLIEGEIAALAAARTGPSDVDTLEGLILRQESVLGDAVAYRVVDTEFHRRIAALSDNPFLARAAESLNLLGLEFRKTASETPDVISGSVRDHRRIVEALAGGDAEGARTAMADHMTNVLVTTKKSRDEA